LSSSNRDHNKSYPSLSGSLFLTEDHGSFRRGKPETLLSPTETHVHQHARVVVPAALHGKEIGGTPEEKAACSFNIVIINSTSAPGKHFFAAV